MEQGSGRNQSGSQSSTPASRRHGPPPSDLNVTWTVVIGFIGAIFIFVFIIGIQILYQRADQAQYYQKVVSEVPAELARLRAQQLERINTYRLVNDKQAIAAIPVEQAMQIIAREPQILAAISQSQPAAEQTQPAGQTRPAGGAVTQAATGSAGGSGSQPSGGGSP